MSNEKAVSSDREKYYQVEIKKKKKTHKPTKQVNNLLFRKYGQLETLFEYPF